MSREEEEDLDAFLYGDTGAKDASSSSAAAKSSKDSQYYDDLEADQGKALTKTAVNDDDYNDEESSEDDYEIVLDASANPNGSLAPFSTAAEQQQKSLTAISTNDGKSAAPYSSGSGGSLVAQAQKLAIDLGLVGSIDGLEIIALDIENNAVTADKPWRKPGADITDYFNYGFNELTWRLYCAKQRALREEFNSDGNVSSNGVPNTSASHMQPMAQGASAMKEMIGQHVSNYYSAQQQSSPSQTPQPQQPSNTGYSSSHQRSRGSHHDSRRDSDNDRQRYNETEHHSIHASDSKDRHYNAERSSYHHQNSGNNSRLRSSSRDRKRSPSYSRDSGGPPARKRRY